MNNNSDKQWWSIQSSLVCFISFSFNYFVTDYIFRYFLSQTRLRRLRSRLHHNKWQQQQHWRLTTTTIMHNHPRRYFSFFYIQLYFRVLFDHKNTWQSLRSQPCHDEATTTTNDNRHVTTAHDNQQQSPRHNSWRTTGEECRGEECRP